MLKRMYVSFYNIVFTYFLISNMMVVANMYIVITIQFYPKFTQSYLTNPEPLCFFRQSVKLGIAA